ncbi:hypothetical protein LguiA_008006 [Lonicera macranthoides]
MDAATSSVGSSVLWKSASSCMMNLFLIHGKALISVKEGWYDGGSIALAVIISSVITAISDYKQSLQFRSLNKVKQNIHLEVIRGGRRVEVSIFDIVVGDVVPLRIGNLVPADGILIFGHRISIDDSAITPENKLVHKNSRMPFLMGGCIVADGYGTMLVTSVGLNTRWGKLMATTLDDNGEETPLQGIPLIPMEAFNLDLARLKLLSQWMELSKSSLLLLAYSTRNMIAEKALMTVVEVFNCGEKIVSPNNRSLIPPAVTSLLMEGIAHNTTGCVSMPEPGKDTLVSGSPTEKAILQWGLDLGMNFDAVRSNSSVIHAYLFNPVEKRGDVVVNLVMGYILFQV